MKSMKQSSFEIFLDRLDPTRRADQLAFFRTVAEEGPGAVEELAGRVHRVSCPAALRQLTLEFSYYHPWPQWLPVVERLLRHEKDLALFETGVMALARMGLPGAVAALRGLAQSRATEGFREALDRALGEADPAEAFQHHFERLLRGSAQPADANEGAHQLARLLAPEHLEPLQGAVRHPDPLVFRHALRLTGQIPTPEAAAFLLAFLEETHREALEDREARLHLAAFRNLPRPEARDRAFQLLSEHWAGRLPEALADLASDAAERARAGAEALRQAGLGLPDAFLLGTLLAAREEKPTHLARHLGQAAEEAQQRARRIEFGLDASAEGLASLASQGLIDPGTVLPVLAESLRRSTGRAGVAGALARLVPPTDAERLDLLLHEPDGALRAAALEFLGERKDPALRPALLQLVRDPIADLGLRSLWHLGQLPDPEGTARSFLAQADPEAIQTGLRFAAMHGLRALVPDLLRLVAAEPQEAVLLATLDTLGALGAPEAADPLLALLHSGQPPRVQLALAEALRDLAEPSAALALCGRAKELNAPLLHAVAVEALGRAHEGPERPLPQAAAAILASAVRNGWNDRQPWPLRRRIAGGLVPLHAADPSLWAELADLVQGTLAERRQPGEVAPEDLAYLQSCGRILAQRAQE